MYELDTHRRRLLTRIVVENLLSAEDCAFMIQATALIEEGKAPVLSGTRDHLAYAEKLLVSLGKKIPAIKSIRERTGLGLKEAKELVDNYCTTQDYHDRHAAGGGA